jgi:hypothetical protein
MEAQDKHLEAMAAAREAMGQLKQLISSGPRYSWNVPYQAEVLQRLTRANAAMDQAERLQADTYILWQAIMQRCRSSRDS